jgi:hypothetical protein
MLTFRAEEPSNRPLSNFMALPRQQQDKKEGEDLKTSHHSITPIEAHNIPPSYYIEGD